MLQAAARPCKKQTAFLLRLANFPCGTQSALEKIGALLRVAVAQICGADRSPLAYLDGCPCSASPVSTAGSGSAPQPSTPRCFCRRQRFGVFALHPFIGVPPAAARHPPFGGELPQTAPLIGKFSAADKALPGEKDKTKSPFPHERNEDFFDIRKSGTLHRTVPQAQTPAESGKAGRRQDER